MSRIKKAAITRVGFTYQDYIAAEFLVDFYQNSQLYDWVQLECEIEGIESLDDIVALRKSDKKFILHQVKFTVDPQREGLALSFDWLLKIESKKIKSSKKPKGKKATSLLQKWAKPVLKNLKEKSLFDAALRTNRVPDKTFSDCLKAGLLQRRKIPAEVWKKMVSQIGSEAETILFLKNFRFDHSLAETETALEEKIKNRLMPDYTDELGWYGFINAIKEWSCYKNKPAPRGNITYSLLSQLLSKERPRPLPQDFSVPDGYIPPDQSFHRDFKKELKAENSIVIYGAPGRGKSTYLSYLAKEFHAKKLPTIRHHYFLSLEDSSERFSFLSVSSSLQHQLKRQFPEINVENKGDSLREALEAGGTLSAKKRKPLIIIIDGLDHVWREKENIEQMQHLFSRIFPLPHNVKLIVGTQPVPDRQLPADLIKHIPRNKWRELPCMSQIAVRKWLNVQADNKRFEVPAQKRDSNRFLNELSQAFFEISNGHPLHLVYSFEDAIRQNGTLSVDKIESLPKCPNGEINQYYGLLWRKLPDAAKEILHLCATAEFNWPEIGLIECLGNKASYVFALDQIRHLLEARPSGLVPFHGSILVYLKNRSDHALFEKVLLPKIERWLSKKATPYYQWAWLWIIQLQQGNASPIIAGPNREWAIEALCNGYPISQVEKILDEAEIACFEENDYARLIELRSLKIRILNGSKFQLGEFSQFKEATLSLQNDNTEIVWMSDNLSLISNDDLVITSKLLGNKNFSISGLCLDEMNKRLIYEHQFHDQLLNNSSHDEKTIVELAGYASAEPKRVIKYISQFSDNDRSILRSYLDSLITIDALDDLLAIEKSLPILAPQFSVLEQYVVRLTAQKQALISQSRISKLSAFPLTKCWCLINQKNLLPSILSAPTIEFSNKWSEIDAKVKPEEIFYNRFFTSLETVLSTNYAFEFRPGKLPDEMQSALEIALSRLDECARTVALQINNKKTISPVSFFSFFNSFSPNLFGRDFDAHQAQFAFRKALNSISIDLMFLLKPSKLYEDFSIDEFNKLKSCKWWNIENWVFQYQDLNVSFLDEKVVINLVKERHKKLKAEVTDFSERANAYMDLSILAIRHGLVPQAKEFLRLTAGCILGYGNHKDVSIFEPLKCIEACGDANIGDIKKWLRDLEPIIFHITDFTDGDETRHSKAKYHEILAKYDISRLLKLYKKYIEAEKWYYADLAAEEIVKNIDLSTDIAGAFVSTITSRDVLDALNERALKGDVRAAYLYKQQIEKLGGIRASEKKDTTEKATKYPKYNYSKFLPKNLEKFIDTIGKVDWSHREQLLSEWADYWHSKGEGKQVLLNLRPLIDTKYDYEVTRLLDKAIQISLDVEGKQKAYDWLVLSHVMNRGWDTYWSRGSRERIRIAAKYFSKDWKKYIRDTCKPNPQRGKYFGRLIVGFSELVYFLTLVKENDLAEDISNRLVQIMIGEMADQPIGLAQ